MQRRVGKAADRGEGCLGRRSSGSLGTSRAGLLACAALSGPVLLLLILGLLLLLLMLAAAFASESPELKCAYAGRRGGGSGGRPGDALCVALPHVRHRQRDLRATEALLRTCVAKPIQSTRCPFAAALTSFGKTRAVCPLACPVRYRTTRSAGRAFEANVAAGVRPRA